MALTITKAPDGDLSLGNLRGIILNCSTAGSDYVPTGFPIVAANIGLWKIQQMNISSMPSGYDISWNGSTQKLQFYGINATALGTTYPNTELAASSGNPSTFQMIAIGL
jgi:hypothetical protein